MPTDLISPQHKLEQAQTFNMLLERGKVNCFSIFDNISDLDNWSILHRDEEYCLQNINQLLAVFKIHTSFLNSLIERTQNFMNLPDAAKIVHPKNILHYLLFYRNPYLATFNRKDETKYLNVWGVQSALLGIFRGYHLLLYNDCVTLFTEILCKCDEFEAWLIDSVHDTQFHYYKAYRDDIAKNLLETWQSGNQAVDPTLAGIGRIRPVLLSGQDVTSRWMHPFSVYQRYSQKSITDIEKSEKEDEKDTMYNKNLSSALENFLNHKRYQPIFQLYSTLSLAYYNSIHAKYREILSQHQLNFVDLDKIKPSNGFVAILCVFNVIENTMIAALEKSRVEQQQSAEFAAFLTERRNEVIRADGNLLEKPEGVQPVEDPDLQKMKADLEAAKAAIDAIPEQFRAPMQASVDALEASYRQKSQGQVTKKKKVFSQVTLSNIGKNAKDSSKSLQAYWRKYHRKYHRPIQSITNFRKLICFKETVASYTIIPDGHTLESMPDMSVLFFFNVAENDENLFRIDIMLWKYNLVLSSPKTWCMCNQAVGKDETITLSRSPTSHLIKDDKGKYNNKTLNHLLRNRFKSLESFLSRCMTVTIETRPFLPKQDKSTHTIDIPGAVLQFWDSAQEKVSRIEFEYEFSYISSLTDENGWNTIRTGVASIRNRLLDHLTKTILAYSGFRDSDAFKDWIDDIQALDYYLETYLGPNIIRQFFATSIDTKSDESFRWGYFIATLYFMGLKHIDYDDFISRSDSDEVFPDLYSTLNHPGSRSFPFLRNVKRKSREAEKKKVAKVAKKVLTSESANQRGEGRRTGGKGIKRKKNESSEAGSGSKAGSDVAAVRGPTAASAPAAMPRALSSASGLLIASSGDAATSNHKIPKKQNTGSGTDRAVLLDLTAGAGPSAPKRKKKKDTLQETVQTLIQKIKNNQVELDKQPKGSAAYQLFQKGIRDKFEALVKLADSTGHEAVYTKEEQLMIQKARQLKDIEETSPDERRDPRSIQQDDIIETALQALAASGGASSSAADVEMAGADGGVRGSSAASGGARASSAASGGARASSAASGGARASSAATGGGGARASSAAEGSFDTPEAQVDVLTAQVLVLQHTLQVMVEDKNISPQTLQNKRLELVLARKRLEAAEESFHIESRAPPSLAELVDDAKDIADDIVQTDTTDPTYESLVKDRFKKHLEIANLIKLEGMEAADTNGEILEYINVALKDTIRNSVQQSHEEHAPSFTKTTSSKRGRSVEPSAAGSGRALVGKAGDASDPESDSDSSSSSSSESEGGASSGSKSSASRRSNRTPQTPSDSLFSSAGPSPMRTSPPDGSKPRGHSGGGGSPRAGDRRLSDSSKPQKNSGEGRASHTMLVEGARDVLAASLGFDISPQRQEAFRSMNPHDGWADD